MGRSVFAEENSLSYLLDIAQPDRYSVGLILGQNAVNRDYVVHLARTPILALKAVQEEGSPHSSDTEDEPEIPIIKQIADVNDNWVADHAKHVTRMLPGGVHVLGIFVVGPEDVFSNAGSSNRIRSILAKISRTLAGNAYLHGNAPASDKLVLFVNSNTHKFHCKSVETDKTGTQSVEWKFTSEPTRWLQLDCQMDFDQLDPIRSDPDGQTIKSHFQNILSRVSCNVEKAVCMIDGELKDESELLDSTNKKKKSRTASQEQDQHKTYAVTLYVPSESGVCELQAESCSGELSCVGVLASRVYLHQKATVGEAVRAVKQDVVRSLAARLEMHWDSLIEEESGSPEERVTLHEPPRRVAVALPHCPVTLCDYVFPGEQTSDALVSLTELLDLKVDEKDGLKDLELQADSTEFLETETEAAGEGEVLEDATIPASGPLAPYLLLMSVLAFSLFVLIASVAVQYIQDA